MVKAESLDFRQDKNPLPLFYPTKPPSVLWVWGGKEQEGEEGKEGKGEFPAKQNWGMERSKNERGEDKERRMGSGRYE